MVDSKTQSKILGKIYAGILLFIFGGIVLHAPLSVGFGTLWPDYDLLIKSWKEILMLVAGIILLVILFKTKQFKLLRDPILITVGAYAALHLVLLAYKPTGLASSVAGLAIDLRYVLYFSLVYMAMRLYPNYRQMFIRVGIAGALVVLIFALLQVFILPHDVLKYIGYNTDTISPYLTVDQNQAFIRINSTFRGPNPLGAYAGMVLTLIVAAFAKHKVNSLYSEEKWPLIITAILSVGGLVALWSSYSRSALIGTFVAIAAVLIIAVVKRKKIFNPLVIVAGTLIAIVGGYLLISNNSFVSNVILHENPNGGSSQNSNEGHINSLQDGLGQMIHQPLGDGVGSTGSASLFGNQPTIIENQYLFTAHESGWLGLIYFIGIFGLILARLWKRKQDWLALGLLASGVGLALIGLLLPVWVDDTVAIIWWGLAAIAIFPSREVI